MATATAAKPARKRKVLGACLALFDGAWLLGSVIVGIFESLLIRPNRWTWPERCAVVPVPQKQPSATSRSSARTHDRVVVLDARFALTTS
jgi:hypothetical protein